jgi:hypothetical protein
VNFPASTDYRIDIGTDTLCFGVTWAGKVCLLVWHVHSPEFGLVWLAYEQGDQDDDRNGYAEKQQ